jgi:hypothetical protein
VKMQFPITFILVMLTGTILRFFIPENWAIWQGALLAGGLVGLILWGLFKTSLTEKKVSLWLGVSLMVAAIFASIYLSNIYEKQAGTLIHEDQCKRVVVC